VVRLNDTTWLQWDWQIGTFRGEKDGVIYGEYTGEHITAESLIHEMGVTLTEEQLADLKAEKTE
jgi:hypothetical protein